MHAMYTASVHHHGYIPSNHDSMEYKLHLHSSSITICQCRHHPRTRDHHVPGFAIIRHLGAVM